MRLSPAALSEHEFLQLASRGFRDFGKAHIFWTFKARQMFTGKGNHFFCICSSAFLHFQKGTGYFAPFFIGLATTAAKATPGKRYKTLHLYR